ncbi:MAG: MFS transporter [Clostridiales Family XIII bacterium]|jgi:ACS family glucarate transporter-like MFS transporter|nr:MFS transporter [Clostridiales Family XIII bacterium]
MSKDIAKPETNYRIHMVVFACIAIIINYIDRVNFSVATPTIMETFGITPTQIGLMGSAFFIPYMCMMLPTGYLLNKMGPKKLMSASLILWGLATMATALAYNVATFLCTRVAMGLFEAPGFPTASRVVSVWIPNRERTLASGAFDCCARVGTAFAPPLVVWIIINWGWQTSFVLTGVIAVIFGVIWIFIYHEPDDHPKVSKSELAYIRQEEVVDESGKVKQSAPIPMRKFIFYPRLVRAALAYGCYLYVWNTFTSWMPSFFVNARGFSSTAMGNATMIPYLTAVIAELIGATIFDRWYRAGANLTTIRRTGMAISLIGSAIFIFIAIQATTPFWIVFFLSAFAGISGLGAGNVQAPPVDLAPYGQAGGFSGFYAFGGALGSFFAPMLTGFVIDSQFGYNGGFTLSACVALLGAALFIFNRYERLEARPQEVMEAEASAARKAAQ